MDLKQVDPRALKPNPNNPRRTAPPAQADAQLAASVKATGIIQPPLVIQTGTTKRRGDAFMIIAGHRRVAAAIKAGLERITVLVQPEADAAADPMKSVSENLIRSEMGPVDRWRAMEALASAGWTDAAIAGALGLTPRNIAQLRLLAQICPPMLDRMAQGDMPNESQLRTIAAASTDEQAAVWKANKPKRTETADWWALARGLAKHRLQASDARFGADEAAAFGIAWDEDLFAPAGEDTRSTTQVEAFLEAQQAWLEANLPPGGSIVPSDAWGRPQLPKGARQRWSDDPADGDLRAYAIHPHSGEINEVLYEAPERPSRPDGAGPGGIDQPTSKARADVTQKGAAMIGDLRTEALHRALREQPIEDDRLIGMLVLALAGLNLEVRSGVSGASWNSRSRIAEALTEGGVLTRDPETLRGAARAMLAHVLSCRENHSASGMGARYAGDAIGADAFLPSMATAEFLSCLSKTALEREATASGLEAKPRAKDTRDLLLHRFKTGTWIYPAARFAASEAERQARTNPASLVRDCGDGEDEAEQADEPGSGGTDGDETGQGRGDPADPDEGDAFDAADFETPPDARLDAPAPI